MNEKILYLGENKKETKAWFNALGRSTPFGGTKSGLIKRVSFDFEKSNTKLQEREELPEDQSLLQKEESGPAQGAAASGRLVEPTDSSTVSILPSFKNCNTIFLEWEELPDDRTAAR